jgi:hypothetical protein
VHASDDGVGGQEQGAVGGIDDGRVVADRGEPLTKAPDQGELAGQI